MGCSWKFQISMICNRYFLHLRLNYLGKGFKQWAISSCLPFFALVISRGWLVVGSPVVARVSTHELHAQKLSSRAPSPCVELPRCPSSTTTQYIRRQPGTQAGHSGAQLQNWVGLPDQSRVRLCKASYPTCLRAFHKTYRNSTWHWVCSE